jgi:hypothetical protein
MQKIAGDGNLTRETLKKENLRRKEISDFVTKQWRFKSAIKF